MRKVRKMSLRMKHPIKTKPLINGKKASTKKTSPVNSSKNKN